MGREGELILRNSAGQEGASITLGGQVQVPGDDNILGSTGTFGGALSLRGADRFSLTLAETGSPNLLADLGWDTRLQVGGQQRDDLLLFLAGNESVTISASYGQSDFDPLASLRVQPLEVRFLAGGERYVILEQNSETELATGRFVPGAAIRYGGAVLTLTGSPQGDRFFIEDNRDGVDDNRNLKRLAQLRSISALGDKSGADYSKLSESRWNRLAAGGDWRTSPRGGEGSSGRGPGPNIWGELR